MKKLLCDCCGEDVTKFGAWSFEFTGNLNNAQRDCYIDSKGEMVWYRIEMYDLCHSCYNQIVINGIDEFKRVKGRKNG